MIAGGEGNNWTDRLAPMARAEGAYSLTILTRVPSGVRTHGFRPLPGQIYRTDG